MQRIVGKNTVKIDRGLCIGAGSCVAVAPKAYALDSEAKAIFLDTIEEESWEAIMDGARSCPVAAIIIYDENGKQIFP
jgi:ferredoxin